MKVIIDDTYWVGVERFQYTLYKKVTAKKRGTDEEYVKDSDIGFFNSMDNLIKHIIHHRLVDDDGEMTMKQYLEAITNQNEELIKLFT